MFRGGILTILVVLACVHISCAPKEKIEPLYKSEDYKFHDVTLTVSTIIDEIEPIELNGIRKFISRIPIIRNLLYIPLDITNLLVFNIGIDEEFNPSEGGVDLLSDPDFLSLVKSFKIKGAWLREKSEKELRDRGLDPGDKSPLCLTNGIKFLKDLKVRFEYIDRKYPHNPKIPIDIAYTNRTKYRFVEDPKNKKNNYGIFEFVVRDQNLRPFMGNVKDYKLQFDGNTRIPCEKTFLQVGLTFEVVVKVEGL